jgi:hypothetical protein
MGGSTAIARVISKLLNPFLLSVVALLLVTYVGSSDLRVFLSWVLIILCFVIALPLIYVYIKSPGTGSRVKRIQDPLAFFREHRRDILVVGIVSALPCILLLIFLEAPSLLVATLVALLGTSLAVGLVNVFYRASYHLALVTTLVIVTVLVWGHTFPLISVLIAIPLVGWARYSLRQHSPSQLAAGFGLSIVIGAATLYSFGLLGSFVL